MTGGNGRRIWAAALLLAMAAAAALLLLRGNGGGTPGPAVLRGSAPAGEAEEAPAPEPIEPSLFAEEPEEKSPAPAASRPRGLLVSRRREDAARIHGLWTGGDGGPSAGRRVRLHRTGDAGPEQMVVATGVDGAYEAWVPAGTWRVVFAGDSYGVDAEAGGQVRLDHADPAGGGARVTVSVAGPSVQPWNALVTLTSGGGDGGPGQVLQARTGADGTATFEGVRAGPCAVEGRLQRAGGGRPIRAAAAVEVPAAGAAAAVLRQPLGVLAVAVSGGPSGAPVAGADVEFRPAGSASPAASAVADGTGFAVLDGVLPGPGVLTVRHPEFAPERREADFPAGDALVQVFLGRGLSVPVQALGRAPGQDERPMAIVLRGRTRGEVPPRTWEWRLDDEGRGIMDRLPAEDVAIEILAAGCTPIVVRTGELASRGSFTARFRLLPSPK